MTTSASRSTSMSYLLGSAPCCDGTRLVDSSPDQQRRMAVRLVQRQQCGRRLCRLSETESTLAGRCAHRDGSGRRISVAHVMNIDYHLERWFAAIKVAIQRLDRLLARLGIRIRLSLTAAALVLVALIAVELVTLA